MDTTSLKNRLLVTSLFAGVMGALAVPALAQEAPATVPPAAEEESKQAVVFVTGSRLAQTNLTTSSPVSAVTAEDVKLQGTTRVEDLVVQLPQAFAAQNSTVSNGANGAATVSLRNLGSDRTLVLIDGKRMSYGLPNDSAADLNLIPGQLVERVEIYTGGASAVYGSDAVAGVVNFIMKKDFEGVQLDAQYGFYQHNNDYDTNGDLRSVVEGRAATNPSQFQIPADNVDDGFSKDVTATLGVSAPDDRGNITAYFSFRDNDQVLQRDRDYSACAIGGATATGFTCGGSSTAFPGRFTDFATFDFTIDPATNAFIPWNGNRDLYNFGPLNFYQRPDERYSFGTFANYRINDNAEAYANLMFIDYSSVAQIAPSGNFFSTSTLNCDNPLLSPSQAAAIGCSGAEIASGAITDIFIGRRNVEGGPRQDNISYQTYRGVIGVKGDVPEADGWNYDVNAIYSQATLNRVYGNEFSTTRLNRALDVVTNPANGSPVCRSVLNGTDSNCVPYNIFQVGGVTPEALAYVQVPLVENSTTTFSSVTASVAGDLGRYGLKVPGTSSGLQVAFGAEVRRNEIERNPDISFITGDGAGQGGPTNPLQGAVNVFDVFTEASLPLLTDAPFAKELSLEFAYRYSDYSTDITADSLKLAAKWAPTDDIFFRGSYQKAARAPNVIELFAVQGFNLFDRDDDPCDASDPAGDGVAAQNACVGTAPHQLTLAQYNGGTLSSPAGQYNFIGGGNPSLETEEADTFTIGFVATPSFLPGASLSVDYYDIEIANLISTVGASLTMDLCYEEGDAAACGRINRDPATGNVWVNENGFVVDTNTNIGGLKTAGVDIAAAYVLDLSGLGDLTATVNGTYLTEYEVDPINQAFAVFDCVGEYGNDCGTPIPEWRHRARLAWATPWGFDLAGTWRYFGAADLDSGVTTRVDSTLEAQNYIDLSGLWQARENLQVRFGVNNVLDDDPPLSASVGTTGNGNTFPQTYDALGRFIFVGATIDF